MRRRPPLSLLAVVCLVGCTVAAPGGTGKGGVKTQASRAPVLASAVPSAVSPGASQAPALSSQGQVLGLDGKPAVGVTVRGFLVSDAGSGIIGNNGSGLIANNGGNLITDHGSGSPVGGYRVFGATSTLETKTDTRGRFTLSAPNGQSLNVEAQQSEDIKAISLNATKTDGLTLQLAFVGTLTGRVTTPNTATVSDLSGVDVFIPGTSYQAKTDSAGRYTISGVPVGSFVLYGRRTGLGKGQLTGVPILSKQTTKAPDLPLLPVVPLITTMLPTNGGPGAIVTLIGDRFGATTGETFTVSFGGATVTQPTRKDDHTITAVVPAGANTGDVIVTLDGIPSLPKPFTVLKSISVQTLVHDLALGEKRTVKVVALDTLNLPVASPVLQWKTAGTAVDVDASGAVTANAVGVGPVIAYSGTTASLPFAVTVHSEAVVVSTLAGVVTPGEFSRDAKVPILYEGVGAGVEYHSPYALAAGPDGNLYIADYGGWVSKTTPDGVVSKLAELKGARAIAVGPDNTCYVVADNALVTVSPTGKITPLAGGTVAGNQDGTGSAAAFKAPLGITIAKDGTLYVYDAGNAAIRRVTTGGVVTTLPGITAPPVKASFWDAGPLAMGPDNALYVGGPGISFTRYDVTDPTHPVASTITPNIGTTVPPDVAPRAPFGMTLDAKGNIYFSDPDDGIGFVREIDRSNPAAPKLVTLSGFGGYDGHADRDGAGASAGFANTMGVSLDASGALYVTEWGYERNQQRLRRITLPH
jgi:sugar lactone lactonase YvrE